MKSNIDKLKEKIKEKENKLKNIKDNELYKMMIEDEISQLKLRIFDIMDGK